MTGLFLIAAGGAVAYARMFLVPVILAFLLALVFSPVRRWAERRGLPAGLCAAGIVVGLVCLILAAVAVLTTPVSDWVSRGPEIAAQAEAKLRGLMATADRVMEVGDQIEQATGDDGALEVVVKEPGMVANIVFSTPLVVAQTATVLVLLFFILASGDMFYEKIVHISPTLREKRTAMRIAHDIERRLSRYLFTITTINAGLGVAIGLAMWAVGMPSPALFGVAAFALNFIPFVGAIMGVIATFVVGLISLPEVSWAVIAAAAYFTLTSIEGQFITPHFVGRSLKLNTVVIFVSVALWAWLWSIMGMLMAVPLLVTIRVICEHVPALNSFGDFLSARGVEQEDEPAPARAEA